MLSSPATMLITTASPLSEIFKDTERTLLLAYNLVSAIVNSVSSGMMIFGRHRGRQIAEKSNSDVGTINVQSTILDQAMGIVHQVIMILGAIFGVLGLATNVFGIFSIFQNPAIYGNANNSTARFILKAQHMIVIGQHILFGIIAGGSLAFLRYQIYTDGLSAAAHNFIMPAVQLLLGILTVLEPSMLTNKYLTNLA
ncbi:UNKNOWN [Stylonychia lemnae]|uniref:Uncharacterized protein n=1 Tax=Stylonychia lemnae TaxID=5949 RepID=A0A077ZYQ7_STYLE|nr:UNKNOWN [Stylonychia lemnae]|eukprot:CDW75086.1 UNKNOWN [Stylonychia lemnae]